MMFSNIRKLLGLFTVDRKSKLLTLLTVMVSFSCGAIDPIILYKMAELITAEPIYLLENLNSFSWLANIALLGVLFKIIYFYLYTYAPFALGESLHNKIFDDLFSNSAISDKAYFRTLIIQDIDSIVYRFIAPSFSLVVSFSYLISTVIVIRRNIEIAAMSMIVVLISFLAIILVSKFILKTTKSSGYNLAHSQQSFVRTLDAVLDRSYKLFIYPPGNKVREKLSQSSGRLYKNCQTVFALSLLPKYIIETLIFLGIFGFIVWRTNNYIIASTQIFDPEIIGLLLITTRALPLIQQVNMNLSMLTGTLGNAKRLSSFLSTPTHNKVLSQYLESYKHPNQVSSHGSFEINLKRIVHNRILLSNKEPLTLTMKSGSCYAFVGTSGCGKSTLLDIILNKIEASDGEINYINNKYSIPTISPFVDYCGQAQPASSPLSLKDIFFYEGVYIPNVDRSAFETFRELCCIDSNLIKYTDLFNDNPMHFSGGEYHRLLIMANLIKNKPIVIIDEPTSDLDSNTEITVLSNLASYAKINDKLIISATHASSYSLSHWNIISLETSPLR